MGAPLKKANEYSDEELKQEFNYLKDAGMFQKHICKILNMHRSTYVSRILRLEDPEKYKTRHKKIWRKRLENLEAPEEPKYSYFFDVDAERLRQFREDFKRQKREISIREAIDPYY